MCHQILLLNRLHTCICLHETVDEEGTSSRRLFTGVPQSRSKQPMAIAFARLLHVALFELDLVIFVLCGATTLLCNVVLSKSQNHRAVFFADATLWVRLFFLSHAFYHCTMRRTVSATER